MIHLPINTTPNSPAVSVMMMARVVRGNTPWKEGRVGSLGGGRGARGVRISDGRFGSERVSDRVAVGTAASNASIREQSYRQD